MASLCIRYKRLPATAARLYADAFPADPSLANDWRLQPRYDAACAAALAAAGGGDGAKLDATEKARLRRQALDWLRGELTAWQKSRDAAAGALQRWARAPDLAGVRDAEALAALPAEERDAWRKLWAEVAGLLKSADAPSAGAKCE
jgi:hypothetical protein